MCPSKGFPETCSLLEVVIFSSSEVRLSEFIVYEFSYLFMQQGSWHGSKWVS